MTKYRKKQLINQWNQLRQQLVDIGGKIDLSEAGQGVMAEMLETIQADTIGFGEEIESMILTEQLSLIVSELESYCEEIYAMSQSSSVIEELEMFQVLLRSHDAILNRLEKIETKKLAIFLPYKYSMWDSLKSIYIAANRDPGWEAYVVPIPYANLDENGSVENVVYEKEFFDDVEVIDFEKFSIEANHPDVVYVHNPYDSFNKVTVVLPDFHSEVVRPYTERLVYVPYFFSGEMLPDMHCNLPTYSLFDYIVVPSEYSKKQISVYQDENKVLALGSPKIDCIVNKNINKKLPQEWEKLIRGRKVVLYNNSLNAIINQRFHDILKMRQVFDYFKNNQDMVLWWRPHPLIKSTIKSMCPELLGAYEEMEKAYLVERVGIYDITADSNRAIAFADAFLGDASSMQNLFGILGKPIFLLDDFVTNNPEKEDKTTVFPTFPVCYFEKLVEKWTPWQLWTEDDLTFFWDWSNRCIFTMHRDYKKTQIIQRVEKDVSAFWVENTDDGECSFRFFPRFKEGPVLIYNVHKQVWTKEYDDPVLNIELEKQGGLTLANNIVYIFPGRNEQLISVDRKTGDIKKYSFDTTELSKYRVFPGENLLMNGMLIKEKIYMLSTRANKVLEFDTIRHTFKLHTVGRNEIRFGNYWYVYSINCFWLVAWDGSCIIKWNPDTGEQESYDINVPGYIPRLSMFDGSDRPAYNRISWRGDELILVPCLANMFLKVNIHTGEIKEWKLNLPFEIGQRKSTVYNIHDNFGWSIYPDDNHMLLQSNYDGSMMLIDMETDNVELFKIHMSEEEYLNYTKPAAERNYRSDSGSYVFYEDAIGFPFRDMMDFFQRATDCDLQPERQKEFASKGIINADGTCGEKVHRYIDNSL